MDPVVVTDFVRDRRTGEVAWVVVAAYLRGASGDPVCIDYRVRQVGRRDGAEMPPDETVDLMERLGKHSTEPAAPTPLEASEKGIPRYVFEEASQTRLLERGRQRLARLEKFEQLNPQLTTLEISGAERDMLTPATRKSVGRPPQRSLGEKLEILAAVEAGGEQGRTLEEIAGDFFMSRSALRDLLSWARRDASPRLFTGRGQGRAGGQLTPEALAMLEQARKAARGE